MSKVPIVSRFLRKARAYRGARRGGAGDKSPDSIERILRETRAPSTERSEGDFEAHQAAYPARVQYAYDTVSIWRRTSIRLHELLGRDPLKEPGKRVLDVGSGDGVLCVGLKAAGHHAVILDQDDWRHAQAKDIPAHFCNASEAFPLEDNSFDFACSYNSFEHFPDPEKTFSEMVRVVRPGGGIRLEFNPLYASPWGLHAYRMITAPYCHFLYSESFIDRKLDELGIYDLGAKRTALQPVNKWKAAQFRKLWRRAGCEIANESLHHDKEHLDLVLRYPEAFQGRGLTYEDLTVSGFTVDLRVR